jgi:hypothetical protein
MKTLKFLLLFSMIFISFESFSQSIENVYYDKFILVEKETNKIITVEDFQTTISFNFQTKIFSIISPAIVDRFIVNYIEKDSEFVYFSTTCIDHNVDTIMIANIDGTRFILYDYDEEYYYVFEATEYYI